MILNNSCTKVSENFIIGTWNILSNQRNDYDEDGWYELMFDDEKGTITFNSDGSFFIRYSDGYNDQGVWSYIESRGQLRLFGMIWDVSRPANKEMELRFDGSDFSEIIFLKKIG